MLYKAEQRFEYMGPERRNSILGLNKRKYSEGGLFPAWESLWKALVERAKIIDRIVLCKVAYVAQRGSTWCSVSKRESA